ncbi:hypothetical protein CDL12_28871 [Handroanthus impetiginosus]|uniref:Phytosulfokine-beta n=1 Tax=Handroanthus impetiginosus TaxID=429701 RepID=A0A2G9G037_9LAMI|nr:hypothetical protein CDL12_28871 [Handroanthus impetiginosus]
MAAKLLPLLVLLLIMGSCMAQARTIVVEKHDIVSEERHLEEADGDDTGLDDNHHNCSIEEFNRKGCSNTPGKT